MGRDTFNETFACAADGSVSIRDQMVAISHRLDSLVQLTGGTVGYFLDCAEQCVDDAIRSMTTESEA
jgi:hypothetical protein